MMKNERKSLLALKTSGVVESQWPIRLAL